MRQVDDRRPRGGLVASAGSAGNPVDMGFNGT
jgi:hypothetical protein